MTAIYILWLRELKRYTRSRAQIIASLGQPMLYLLVLGFGLGSVFQRAGFGSYLQFIAPGIVGMTGSYDLIRGLHIIAVIAWMAGLLYLPRPHARRHDG